MADLPRARLPMVATVVARWQQQALGVAEVAGLLRRLGEKPLHTEPYSGAVRIGDAHLMLYHGSLIAAFDPVTGEVGEPVIESLPERGEAVLQPVPKELPIRTIQLLALVVDRDQGRLLHKDLDSSFVNLPAMARDLAAQHLDGVIRLKRGDDHALILLDRGRAVLQLFAGSWPDAPLQRNWESWISSIQVQASVVASELKVLFPSYRLRLENLTLELTPTAGSGKSSKVTRSTSMLRKMLGSDANSLQTSFSIRPEATAIATRQIEEGALSYQDDPVFRFLTWMTTELAPYLSERKRAPRWKYLVEWLPLIRHAVLHHHLPRPSSPQTDFFDLVTFSEGKKVLHIIDRVAAGSLDALNQFVSRVVDAKTARIKTGDVGAACLIAPWFSEEAIAAYAAGRDSSGSGTWEMTLSESITGYEGFVRLGPRRGFHLLLVKESEEQFTPILPDTGL
jgi:hypothetical protein